MTPLELLGCLWILMFLGYLFKPPQSKARRVRIHKTNIGPPPVTPEPVYICENCGMLVLTGHGHTREECADHYAHSLSAPKHLRKRPFYPDHRLTKPVYKGRNDPKVRKPFYYEAGKFFNWGAGKEATL